MRTSTSSERATGNVLVTTLVIAAVVGITLASFLALASTHSKSVARSQIWNSAMAVSEAGIEDGMQLLNKFVGTTNLAAWKSNYAVDGWTRTGANIYQLTRYTDAAHTTSYEVRIIDAGNAPIVRSVSSVPGPVWIAGRPPLSRTVEINTQVDSLFNVCMAALGQIDLKGNGIATDSFDSTDPNYSTNGLYTRLKRKAGGDVVTNNTITNTGLLIGNANIAGHVTTGPNGTIDIGPQGSVGDLPWVNLNTPGIQPGWSGNDLNVVFRPVVLPNVAWQPIGGPNSGTGGSGVAPDGNRYDHVFTSTGNYTVTDSGSIYVGTNAAVRLNVTAATYDPREILVAGVDATAGRLGVYLNGPPGQSVVLGTDDRTESGRAVNLIFFGLPNCNSLSYKGNGDFTGAIYAPAADFHLAGGGNDIIDFVGSSVTRTVQMNGHYNFHYDESLKNFGPNNGYVAVAWKEL